MSSASASTTATTTPTATSSASLRKMLERVADWQDPRYSAKYVVGLNIACLMANAIYMNPLSLVLYICGLSFIFGFCLTKFLGWREDGESQLVSEGQAQRLAESVRQSMNIVFAEAKRVFYWSDTRRSGVITFMCFMAGKLLTIFSIPMVALILADCYLLHKPAIELYKKHGEHLVQPHLKMSMDKAQNLCKSIPNFQEVMSALYSSGKSKKL